MRALHIAQIVISIMLFLVLFFGIGFILNMLLKTTWFPSLLYPVIIVALVSYYNKSIFQLLPVDLVILSAGFLGAIMSGYTIKLLRAKGYRMF